MLKVITSQMLTARERIEALVDPGSLQPNGFPAEGVVTGAATVAGRLIHLASDDYKLSSGPTGISLSMKIAETMQQALEMRSPFVHLYGAQAACVRQDIGLAKVRQSRVRLSGAVPQIALMCDPDGGGSIDLPALVDFIIHTRQAETSLTGMVHFTANDDREGILICRKLLSFLPSSNMEDPPQVRGDRNVGPNSGLRSIVPVESTQGYDVRNVIANVIDFGDFLEVQADYAPNLVAGFGRVMGKTVGVVANQPLTQAGMLDIAGCGKAERFVRFCSAFNIPLVTFVDTPGFAPGAPQEQGALMRHSAALLRAYWTASVPKVTVVLRNAAADAYHTMCAKDLGADRVYAWPEADVRAVDAAIDPAETRFTVAQALEQLRTKHEPRPCFRFFDHVAVAVKPGELDAHVAAYRALGFRELHREDVLGTDQVREVLLAMGEGPNLLQLLEPLSPESPVSAQIEKNGGRGGFAHVAFRVADIQKAFDQMKAAGFRIIDPAPRNGSRGTRVFFVHPKTTETVGFGYLIEVVQEDRGDGG